MVVGARRRRSRSRRGRGSRRRTRCPTSGATARRCSTYTGKVLNYILATPEQPDDADNPLRLAIGNEASARDIREFARRFGCTVRDSYGSTEGIIIIRRDPSMPDGALGTADDTVKVLDPETGEECPPVQLRPDGRPTNLDEAVGEIVETAPTSASRATTRTRRRPASASATAGTGRATSPTATPTAGSTSPGGRTSGCASTVRTSPPRRSRRSSRRHPDVRSARRLRRARRPGRRPRHGRARAVGRAGFDPAAFDAFLGEQPDLGTEVGAGVRPGHRRAARSWPA